MKLWFPTLWENVAPSFYALKHSKTYVTIPRSIFLDCLTTEGEGAAFFETLGTTHPSILSRIMEDINRQIPVCLNFRAILFTCRTNPEPRAYLTSCATSSVGFLKTQFE
jgi:hypothetical protein